MSIPLSIIDPTLDRVERRARYSVASSARCGGETTPFNNMTGVYTNWPKACVGDVSSTARSTDSSFPSTRQAVRRRDDGTTPALRALCLNDVPHFVSPLHGQWHVTGTDDTATLLKRSVSMNLSGRVLRAARIADAQVYLSGKSNLE